MAQPAGSAEPLARKSTWAHRFIFGSARVAGELADGAENPSSLKNLVNPYRTPSTSSSPPPEDRGDGTITHVKPRRRCEKCGSTNTSGEEALRSKPSILAVIFFGWVFLLIRSAFSKCREHCHDCGAVRVYKTTASMFAMVFLLLLVFLSVIGYFASL